MRATLPRTVDTPQGTIDARDLMDLRTTNDALREAQTQAQIAAETALATRGAYTYVWERIRARYGLAADDRVELATGAVIRATTGDSPGE